MTVQLQAAEATAGVFPVQSITYSATGAQPIASTTVNGSSASINITAEGQTTITYFATDAGGNVEAQQSVQVNIDKTLPAITITAPTNAIYMLNQAVTASYTCSDGGSGVASCAGPVASGSPINTASVGTQTFTVQAADNAGNTASQSVRYTVAYNICPLFDLTKAVQSGSTLPVKLQLCDANGTNASSPSIVVHALSVDGGPVQAPGNSQPGNNFTYSADLGGTGGYQFNLKTTGLASGTHTLSFTTAGDPTVHTVRFQVK